MFVQKLREQHEVSATAAQGSKAAFARLIPLQLGEELLSLKKKINVAVREQKASSVCGALAQVKLTPAQRERPFALERHLILNEALRKCPFCQLHCVVSLEENDTIDEDNDDLNSEYTES